MTRVNLKDHSSPKSITIVEKLQNYLKPSRKALLFIHNAKSLDDLELQTCLSWI